MARRAARKRPSKRRWVQRALKKRRTRGALHRQLGVPVDMKIPLALLRKASRAVGKLGRRARLALTMRKFRHKKRAR